MKSEPGFFGYKNGKLYCENVPLQDLAVKYGTPLYVYSKNAFLKPLTELQKGLSGFNATVCFALKSNSNISNLNVLRGAGAGVDLVSGGELYRAQLVGVKAQDILYSGIGKTTQEMRDGLNYENGAGIFAFIVESLEELTVLNSVAKSMGKRARIGIRFNPNVNAKTHPYISTGLRGNKFGLPKNDILEIAKNIQKFENIEWNGIGCHIGSQLLSLSPLKEAYTHLLKLSEQVEKILGRPLTFFDLGGGLGIRYQNETPPAIDHYCKLIAGCFSKKKNYRILLEPGRVISGNAGVLLTEVLFRKSNGKKQFIVVDASMTELIRPALYQSYHSIIPLNEKKARGKAAACDVVGPVCESSDFLAQKRKMSSSLIRGDFLAVLSAGAYGYSMSSQYNSRPRVAEILVDQASAWMIRDRESYKDLVEKELSFLRMGKS